MLIYKYISEFLPCCEWLYENLHFYRFEACNSECGSDIFGIPDTSGMPICQ